MGSSIVPGWPSPTCSGGDLTIHTKRLRVCPAARSQRIFTEDRLASGGRMVHHSIAVVITSFLTNFVELRHSELRRIPLLGNWVNKGRDGRLTPPPLASGWSRQPIGYGGPQNDEVKGHRHQLCGSEESHHQQERQDSSSHSQHPPPAKRNPDPDHRQGREEKQPCCGHSQEESREREAGRHCNLTQRPTVATAPGPSPPQQAAKRPLGFSVQGNEVRSREVGLEH